MVSLPLSERAVFAQLDDADTATDAKPPAAVKDIADMDIFELVKVRVSPFDVSVSLDEGYRASNSVSASRFDARIGDLPFAIQAFTESFIEDRRPVNLYDVAGYSPGVTYRSNDFNEGNANLAIRGFAISSTPGNVQVLRDGFHGPSILDFTNISRLEVVKGPASFLYGQVAPGGIVNVITKTPQPERSVSARVTYGSYDQYRFDLDATGPASKMLFYRVAASYDQDISYWDPYDAHSWDIAPSLLWQPNERVSVTLKYERFRKEESPPVYQKPGYNRQAGVVPTASDPNLSGIDVPGLPDNWNSMSFADYRDSETDGLSAWIDYKIDDHWNVRAAYTNQDYKIGALFSGNLGMANNMTLLQGRRLRKQVYTNRDDTAEIQAVGQYRFDHASLRLLLGAQYVDRRFDQWAAQAPNDPELGDDPTASPLPLWDLGDPTTWNRVVEIPLSTLTENAADRTTDSMDKSVYGGATLGLFDDRLLVLLGCRYTDTTSEQVDRVSAALPADIAADAVTPQYGVLYKLGSGLSLFATYAESFVPGSQILNGPDGTMRPAEPTEGWGYDLGIKADMLGNRVSGTLTFFDVRNQNIVNDLARTDSSGAVTIYNVQSGEQRSQGVELSSLFSATENWQLYFSYSYMDARITEFSGHDAEILAQDWSLLDPAGQSNYRNVNLLHDAPLQMSAPQLANFWTRYDFSSGGLAGTYLGAGFNYVFDQTVLPDGPESSHQTYTLLNALAGYAWESNGHQMSVELIGRNLADEYYRPSQSSRSRPRELLISFSSKF